MFSKPPPPAYTLLPTSSYSYIDTADKAVTAPHLPQAATSSKSKSKLLLLHCWAFLIVLLSFLAIYLLIVFNPNALSASLRIGTPS